MERAIPQHQQLAVPQLQPQPTNNGTFLSTPPQMSPPDPIQELRKIKETLTHRMDTLTRNVNNITQRFAHQQYGQALA